MIDEIVWSRQLVLVFGNTTQAVSAILAGFFGGIAIGSYVGGRVADRVRDPLRMYGFLELALAVVVLVTPFTFRLINGLYRDIYPSLEASPGALAVLRVAMAVLALAPATILMGATLPTLTRYLARGVTLTGAFSKLYAANTIGAIIGTTVAGFVLIELLGLSGALAVGAGCSVAAGLVAPSCWTCGSAAEPRDRRRRHRVEAAPPPSEVSPRRAEPRLALVVAFISGLTSLGYQVAWTRLLASGTGNTTYVFTTILAVFLIGIGLGAVLFAVLRTRLGDPIRLLAASQVAAGALALAGLVLVLVAPHTPTPGQPFASLLTSARIIAPRRPAGHDRARDRLPGVVGPAHGRRRRTPATGRARLLATNTVGAILGSLLVPFVLIPWLGSPVLVAVLRSRMPPSASPSVCGGCGRRPVAGSPPSARSSRSSSSRRRSGRASSSSRTRPTSTRSADACSTHARTRSRPSRPARSVRRPELWVAGTSMTLLTIDAKLMPVLPLIARPEQQGRAHRRVRDGLGVPRSAHRGPQDRRRRTRARACPRCSVTTTRMPRRSSPTRTGT